MTLYQEILAAQSNLRQAELRVEAIRQWIRELEEQRISCEHEWGEPYPGYEHEGRHCVKCGINEIFEPTFKKIVETQKAKAKC